MTTGNLRLAVYDCQLEYKKLWPNRTTVLAVTCRFVGRTPLPVQNSRRSRTDIPVRPEIELATAFDATEKYDPRRSTNSRLAQISAD